jgi:hypothetical protein
MPWKRTTIRRGTKAQLSHRGAVGKYEEQGWMKQWNKTIDMLKAVRVT